MRARSSLVTQRYEPILRRWYPSSYSPIPLEVGAGSGRRPVESLGRCLPAIPSLEERILFSPGVLLDGQGDDLSVLGELVGAPDYLFTLSPQARHRSSTGRRIGATDLDADGIPDLSPEPARPMNQIISEPISLDTIIDYDPAAAASQQAGVDPYVAHCNLPFDPTLDLGEVVATLPDDPWAGAGTTDHGAGLGAGCGGRGVRACGDVWTSDRRAL